MIEETVYAPHPDYTAKDEEASLTEYWEDIWCSSCGRDYKIYITSRFSKINCFVKNENVKFSFGSPYDASDSNDELFHLINNSEILDTFNQQVLSIEKLIDLPVEEDVKFNLLVMLHGHLVAAIEHYLASTCIQKITNSDTFIRNLIETDPSFAKKTLTFEKLFIEREKIRDTVAVYLKDLIFHNIDKVKPLYRSVFNIDFGQITWLFIAVNKRHDCVHRGGYNKDGKKINISREELLNLVKNARGLIEKIEYSIEKLDDDGWSLI